jgi:hypothetical protein
MQINRKLDLSRVIPTESLAGREKIEKQSKKYNTVTEPAAVKTDTVQLSQESLALANSVKNKSGDKEAPKQKIVDANVLVELLKKADKKSGIFGSNEEISKTIEQESRDNKSGGKIDFLL